MEARYDIRLDAAYINANNDAEWFASDSTHVKHTIQATPGSYKESPADGVAINLFLNSAGQEDEVAQKIMFELSKDFYQCTNPLVSYDTSGKLTIDPNL
jgi:hypothetical protein